MSGGEEEEKLLLDEVDQPHRLVAWIFLLTFVLAELRDSALWVCFCYLRRTVPACHHALSPCVTQWHQNTRSATTQQPLLKQEADPVKRDKSCNYRSATWGPHHQKHCTQVLTDCCDLFYYYYFPLCKGIQAAAAKTWFSRNKELV